MRGEIICIGDELISGRVAEGNSRYAMSRLNPLGFVVRWVGIVGDMPEDITYSLTQALGRADFVICCGGLGATDDDITAKVAAQVFGLELTESKRMVANLRACFQAMGMEMPEVARKMAWLPDGAKVLCPTCAGFKLSAPDGKPVFFLPGVPREMRRLVDRKIIPELLSYFGNGLAVVSRKLRIFGAEEAEVCAKLEGLAKDVEGASVGYYPVFPEVQVQISIVGKDPEALTVSLDKLVARAQELLGRRVVAGDDPLEEVVGRKLRDKGLSLSLAESCTGGLIGHRITSRPGSSDYFKPRAHRLQQPGQTGAFGRKGRDPARPWRGERPVRGRDGQRCQGALRRGPGPVGDGHCRAWRRHAGQTGGHGLFRPVRRHGRA